MSSVSIEAVAIGEPAVLELIDELDAELRGLYPEQGAVHHRLDAADVAPGHGVLLAAVEETMGRMLGCGAARLREPGVVEITRMYVRPHDRGRGVGRALLGALEAEAEALFADRVVLEIGARQLEAVELYRRAGYSETERPGEHTDSPLSLCMSRTLH